MDITQNYFEFLQLPEQYDVDQALLSEHARELQKKLHPDRYAHLSDHERRLSVQYTTYLNEAVATLKSPLLRAQYLLKLKGIDTQNEATTQMDTGFLMQQMMLRERVAEVQDAADPEAELDELREEAESSMQALQAEFVSQFEVGAFEDAATLIRKMQFMDKLSREIELIEDDLF